MKRPIMAACVNHFTEVGLRTVPLLLDYPTWYNTACLACGNIEKEMVKYDCLVFCFDCFEGGEQDIISEEGYAKWLKKHMAVRT